MDGRLSRRQALAGGAGAIVAAVGAGCAGGSVGQGPRLSAPEEPEWLAAGPLEGLSAETYMLRRKVRIPDVPRLVLGIYLRLESDTVGAPVIAISNRCTHLGCPVRYIEASRRFICPCHGGVFDRDGRVEGGPVKRPLNRYRTRVYDGTVYVGDLIGADGGPPAELSGG
jgi:Rieske Fe-S protein